MAKRVRKAGIVHDEASKTLDSSLRVFVSYSRKDAKFADEIVGGLEYGGGFDVTIDRHDIHEGEDWKVRLEALIVRCDVVVFIVSPNSAQSEICHWEVARSVELGKRVVPALLAETAGATVPPQLAQLNYVRFDGGRSFVEGLSGLRRALRTDLGWIREHTRLLERAMEWEQSGRAENRLLVGTDVPAAQKWLEVRPEHAPPLTERHRDFIAASAKAEAARTSMERERVRKLQRAVLLTRFALGAAVVVALLAASIGVYANQQRIEAERSTLLAKKNAKAADEGQKRARAALKLARENEGRAEKASAEAQTQAALANAEKAKAELSARAAAAAALEAELESIRADENRAAMQGVVLRVASKIQATWLSDDRSPDYRHLQKDIALLWPGYSVGQSEFQVTYATILQLLAANSMSIQPTNDRYLIVVLRGATIPKETSVLGKEAITLVDARPNHRSFRSAVVIVDLESRLLSAFQAASVPAENYLLEQFRAGNMDEGDRANLWPTGVYRTKLRTFHQSTPSASPAAFVTYGVIPVRRTIDDLSFEIDDPWSFAPVSNAVTAARFLRPTMRVQSLNREVAVEFLSSGSITVPGSFDRIEYRARGAIGELHAALGLSSEVTATKVDGRLFLATPNDGMTGYIYILTGTEAGIASMTKSEDVSSPKEVAMYRRLRFGSEGLSVEQLQTELEVTSERGVFGVETAKTLVAIQDEKLGWSDGIYSPEMDELLGFCVFQLVECDTLRANETEPETAVLSD